MSVDERIRDALLRTSNDLPEPDLEAALRTVTARASDRRRSAVLGAVAAVAVVGSAVAVGSVLDRPGPPETVVPPAASTAPTEDVRVNQDLTRPRDTVGLGIVPPEGAARTIPPDPPSTLSVTTMTLLADPADTQSGWIDILDVRILDLHVEGRQHWDVFLSERPAVRRSVEDLRDIEYGIVVDVDGDRVPDCEIGLSTDAPTRGDLRAWVSNLATGQRMEQVGPPYGPPFDFLHPEEQLWRDPGAGDLQLLFQETEPCTSPHNATHVYLWAALLDEDGGLIEMDFAPDEAWVAVGDVEPTGLGGP